MAATDAYRAEQDVLGRWLDERCTLIASLSTKAAVLYSDYRDWCSTTGENEVTQNRFALALNERGLTSQRTKNGYFWGGVGLLHTAGEPR